MDAPNTSGRDGRKRLAFSVFSVALWWNSDSTPSLLSATPSLLSATPSLLSGTPSLPSPVEGEG
jgi:hypothetical protein